MADPFATLAGSMVSVPSLIGLDQELKRNRLAEAYRMRESQARDEQSSRQQKARGLIAAGAKPDEVMGVDTDIGSKYADYVRQNGDAAHEQAVRQATAIVNIGSALKQAPRGSPQRAALWRQAQSALQKSGVTPDEMAGFDPNDDNAIDAQITANRALLKAGEDYTLGRTRFSGVTNQPIASVPEDDKWLSIPEGGRLQRIPGAGGAMPAAQGSVPGQGTVALDGNNPGGINDGDFARSQPGYKGANGRYAAFETIEQGENAQRALLRSYIARGYDTPSKIASRWAPAGDGGNNPQVYAQNIARQLGIGVDDRLSPDDVLKFQVAQGRQENSAYRPGMADTPDVIYGAPKRGYRAATPQEKVERGLPADVSYQVSPDGQFTAVGGQREKDQPLKPVPASAAQKYAENNTSLKKIDRALDAIEANPDALGMQNYAPDWIMQRADPGGVDVRAKISDIGSLLIHDRSGAAVTISETPRLLPFIPSKTDNAQTVKTKLANLRQAIADMQSDTASIYAVDQGYKGLPPIPERGAKATRRNTAAPPAGAVSMLRQNPGLAAQFDAKYGPGSARKALGR